MRYLLSSPSEQDIIFMKKIILFALIFSVFSFNAIAQDDLFGKESKLPPRKGWVLGFNAGIDLPAADMAKRFGTSYRVGVSTFYKTKSNWMFGPKVDFMLGNRIREDSFMINLFDSYNQVLNQDGQRINVKITELGYIVGLQAGRIFNLSKKSSENGILAMTTVGFIQHKINIFLKNNDVPELRKDYKKGYDRLTNGIYVEQYLGYNYFSNSGLINFHIGLDVGLGITKDRRDYLFDVRRADDKSRFDVLFGIRGGWYIPIFKRKSEEFYFE
jgi:hypothetical protein